MVMLRLQIGYDQTDPLRLIDRPDDGGPAILSIRDGTIITPQLVKVINDLTSDEDDDED